MRWNITPNTSRPLIAALLLGGGGGAFAVASLGPDAVELAGAPGARSRPAAAAARADRGARRAQLQAVSHRGHAAPATPPRRCWRAWAWTTRAAAAYLRSDADVPRRSCWAAPAAPSRSRPPTVHALQQAQRALGPGRRRHLQAAGDRAHARRPVRFAHRNRAAGRPPPAWAAPPCAVRCSPPPTRPAFPDAVVGQMVDIFSGDIDFHRALRSGDRFSVVYEALEADGEPLRTGRVLSAEFVNKGQLHQAMWFQEPGHKGGYYTLDGKSLDTSYLASPVEFSRVTSGFAMRLHPILHQLEGAPGHRLRRRHRHAGAHRRRRRGRVRRRAERLRQRRHRQAQQHRRDRLRAPEPHRRAAPARSVNQGQNVGAVGTTGWATGPHLHFEFRVNGVHRDPMAIARTAAAPCRSPRRPGPNSSGSPIRCASQLAAAASSSVVASAD